MPEAGQRPRKHVLVVDDEPGMRETLADILGDLGFEVSLAADGDAALAAARDRTIDLLVLDVQMPNRDGVSVVQELHPPPPIIIMMTAYALEERLAAAMDAKIYALVRKPFHPGRLIDLVEAATATPVSVP